MGVKAHGSSLWSGTPALLDTLFFGQKYVRSWKTFFPDAGIVDEPNADAALKHAQTMGQLNDGMDALVTGSQHLVSYALSVLRLAVKEDSID